MQDSDFREYCKMRDFYRSLEMKEYRLKLAISGIMAYSAISNLLKAAFSFSTLPFDAAIAIALVILFSFAFYRVWIKNDSRWLTVAFPSGIVIIANLLLLLFPYFVLFNHMSIISIILHSLAIILVYLREKAIDALAFNSYKWPTASEFE